MWVLVRRGKASTHQLHDCKHHMSSTIVKLANSLSMAFFALRYWL